MPRPRQGRSIACCTGCSIAACCGMKNARWRVSTASWQFPMSIASRLDASMATPCPCRSMSSRPVSAGEHVLLADEPRTFARAVVRLLRDVDRRRQLEAAARALVVERYDWSAVAGALEESLVRVASTLAFEPVRARANNGRGRVA